MISLIIPVYKVEAYLGECLDSVLAQTFKDMEIICVNDGSPDNCLSILEEYQKKDSRIRIINKENQGLAAARNTGIENARGEYIAFLDSDDKVAPDFLEKLYAHITEADCVEVGVKYFKNDEELLHLDEPSAWFDKFLFNKTGLFEVKPSLWKHIFTGCWNKLFKKEIIDKYNLRFIKGIIHEDNYFTFAYLSHSANIYEVGKKLHYYRNRENSQSKTVTYAKYFDTEENYMQLAEHLKKFDLAKKFRRAVLWLFVYYSFLENKMECDRERTIQNIKRLSLALDVNYEKILEAIEPKKLCVMIQMPMQFDNISIEKCSCRYKKIFDKDRVFINMPVSSFNLSFVNSEAMSFKLFFVARNYNISDRRVTDNHIQVKEIKVNNQKIFENTTLDSKPKGVIVHAKANNITMIEISV